MKAGLAGAVAGVLATLSVEVGWLAVRGVHIAVPAAVVTQVVSKEVAGVSQGQWAHLSDSLERQMQPELVGSVDKIVGTVHIQVDGLNLDIDRRNERRLRERLLREMTQAVGTYLERGDGHRALAEPLAKTLLAHPQQVRLTERLGPLAIPVTVSIP